MENLSNCPDCSVEPGRAHLQGCDVERCSACGERRLTCSCGGVHDPAFARWTGFWPGETEAAYLKIDLSALYDDVKYRFFFIKPKE